MSLRIICGNLIPKLIPFVPRNVVSAMEFHTSFALAGKINRIRSRSEMLKTVPKKEDGTADANTVDVDVIRRERFQRYPDANLPDRLFGNVPFKDLPIIHIRVSKNNTIVDATNSKGKIVAITSCGKEGFKNCRKGTNVAGQATAISLAKTALTKGMHTVRVVVRGLGPGRASSIKGLEMGGLTVVSITDATRVSDNPPRPRKARRV